MSEDNNTPPFMNLMMDILLFSWLFIATGTWILVILILISVLFGIPFFKAY